MPFYVWSCGTHEDKWEKTFEHKMVPVAPTCACGEQMERDWHRESSRHIPASGFPYVTKNITGKEVTVRDSNHEAELCKRHGVAKRDDAAWLEKRYKGYNPYTGEQEYTEGSGMGVPGTWI